MLAAFCVAQNGWTHRFQTAAAATISRELASHDGRQSV